jgi:hypothetical protein
VGRELHHYHLRRHEPQCAGTMDKQPQRIPTWLSIDLTINRGIGDHHRGRGMDRF